VRSTQPCVAPVARRVAVFDGLERRSVTSTRIVSGPCASFATLALHGCHVWLFVVERHRIASLRGVLGHNQGSLMAAVYAHRANCKTQAPWDSIKSPQWKPCPQDFKVVARVWLRGGMDRGDGAALMTPFAHGGRPFSQPHLQSGQCVPPQRASPEESRSA
jgi:hypothetical protein